MMASPPRRALSVTPPFTPLRSPPHRTSVEEKVVRQLAALPGPDEEGQIEELAAIPRHGQSAAAAQEQPEEAAMLLPDSSPGVQGESSSNVCDTDDTMLQYLGSMDEGSGGSEESEAGSDDGSFDVGMLDSPTPRVRLPPATSQVVAKSPDDVGSDDAVAQAPEEIHPSRAATPQLSAVSSAVPALFTGCDPVRMRQQISLLTRQVQRGEDSVAALHSRLAQAKADRDNSELSNVELRERADAVRQHVLLLKAQVQQLSGVQAPTLEELRGGLLAQAQKDAAVLAQNLAKEQQLVRQLYAQIEDQALADKSERDSLASEVERLLRSAAFSDTICSQHQRRTDTMQKELMEQQKQTKSLQSRLDAEQLRCGAAEREVNRMEDQLEQRVKEVAALQTQLDSVRASQEDMEDKLTGAHAMIQDLENQLADLRSFSGRGRGGDLGAVAGLEEAVTLRKAAEAECERLRQELDRVAMVGRANAADADDTMSGDCRSSGTTVATSTATSPQLERPNMQRQSTKAYAKDKHSGKESAVTEELQELRANMQALLQRQFMQPDEDGPDEHRLQQDSKEPQPQELQEPQQPQRYVPLQADSEQHSVPSAPTSDCNLSAEISDITKVPNAEIDQRVAPFTHETTGGFDVGVSLDVDMPEPMLSRRKLPRSLRPSRHSDSSLRTAATAGDMQSRQEVEHILSALQAARRSLDLSASDGPGAFQSAHTRPSALRSDFLSQSAPPAPRAPAPPRRSFAHLQDGGEMKIDRWEDGLSESARLVPARDPLMSRAGHNNRYSMY